MTSRRRVLIIDDDAAYRQLLGQFMAQNGWQVSEAGNGEGGVEVAMRERPAAVICDLLMPGGNGFQVCRTLRNSLVGAAIVVMSGRDYASDRQTALEAGANDYLVKPVKPSHLVEVISRLLSELQPGAEGTAERAPRKTPTGPAWFKFWGVRGSIPTPGPGTVKYGGNTCCLEVRSGGQIIILDAGTGLRLLGRQLLQESGANPLEMTLLLTHTHWDHIQGLPFFLPLLGEQNRLRILGYEGARQGLDSLLSSQMESPFFPIGLREVAGNIRIEELKELSFDIGPVKVHSWFANHPGICVGYRLTTAEGSLAFFPDNEPYLGRLRTAGGTLTEGPALEYARAEHGKLIEFLRGTDVLIMDTQYDAVEYQQHVGWGHGCLDDVVPLALEARVRKLFLFHHDPDHDDAKIDAMVDCARNLVQARAGRLEVEAAREGQTEVVGG